MRDYIKAVDEDGVREIFEEDYFQIPRCYVVTGFNPKSRVFKTVRVEGDLDRVGEVIQRLKTEGYSKIFNSWHDRKSREEEIKKWKYSKLRESGDIQKRNSVSDTESRDLMLEEFYKLRSEQRVIEERLRKHQLQLAYNTR
jgi:hypothetical protein